MLLPWLIMLKVFQCQCSLKIMRFQAPVSDQCSVLADMKNKLDLCVSALHIHLYSVSDGSIFQPFPPFFLNEMTNSQMLIFIYTVAYPMLQGGSDQLTSTLWHESMIFENKKSIRHIFLNHFSVQVIFGSVIVWYKWKLFTVHLRVNVQYFPFIKLLMTILNHFSTWAEVLDNSLL